MNPTQEWAKAKADRFRLAMHDVAKTEAGRTLLYELIFSEEWCGLDSPASMGNSQTFIKAAQQDLGRGLKRFIFEAWPELWTQLRTEGEKHEAMMYKRWGEATKRRTSASDGETE